MLLLLLHCPLLHPHEHVCTKVSFVKSLLFVIKDSPPQMEMFTIEESTSCLELLIKKCHSSGIDNEEEEFTLNLDTGQSQARSLRATSLVHSACTYGIYSTVVYLVTAVPGGRSTGGLDSSNSYQVQRPPRRRHRFQCHTASSASVVSTLAA